MILRTYLKEYKNINNIPKKKKDESTEKFVKLIDELIAQTNENIQNISTKFLYTGDYLFTTELRNRGLLSIL